MVICTESHSMDALASNKREPAPISEAFCVPAARRFHGMLPGYAKTPLVSLPGLARRLGVKNVLVKDESKRFGLNAFKGLGGSWAMFCILCDVLGLDPEKATLSDLASHRAQRIVDQQVFVTATDGNHGRGVAWAGGLFGCDVHVYMPAGSAEVRAEAIRKAGPAKVTVTSVNYDKTVAIAKEQSEKNGWHLIQDTSWPGYEQVPSWIVQGYLTMAAEIEEELEAAEILPTHLFLQAGVGAMAGGVLGYFAARYDKNRPVTAIVEPKEANCVYLSALIADGQPHSVPGDPVTLMAGLNCGTPCGITWPVLRDFGDFYLSCADSLAEKGMRLYSAGADGDEKIVSGESGAATLGALAEIMTDGELDLLREKMGLWKESVVLLISTEGDTDPENYAKILSKT